MELMDAVSTQSLDEKSEDDSQQPWIQSQKKKNQDKGKGRVQIATRASNKVTKDGRSILEKVTQRTIDKDYRKSGLAWSFWKDRNKMTIGKNFPSHPDAVIHAAVHYMQMWVDLLKERDQCKLEQMALT